MLVVRALGGLGSDGEDAPSDASAKRLKTQEAQQIKLSPVEHRKQQAALDTVLETAVVEETQNRPPENAAKAEISKNTVSTATSTTASTTLSETVKVAKSEKRSENVATESARYWLQDGERRLKVRDLDKAESSFRRAGELDPASAPAQIGLGRVELERGHSQQAIRYFQQALALDPKSSQAWLLLGTACQILGQRQAARQAYQRYLALVGDSKKAKEVKQLLEGL